MKRTTTTSGGYEVFITPLGLTSNAARLVTQDNVLRYLRERGSADFISIRFGFNSHNGSVVPEKKLRTVLEALQAKDLVLVDADDKWRAKGN
jgi:hypothetical protein